MPKLTFIVPIYKTEKYLPKVIKAFIEQSYKDWEAVFVLDGPSVDAKNIIRREMRDHSHKVIEIEHGGACRARNEGSKHATGDIWLFWDSDSVIEVHAAKAFMDIFEKQPETGFVYSGYRFFDEKGGIDALPFDPYLLRVANYITTMSPLRRELFPGWDESIKSLQDWDFWLSVVEKGGIGEYVKGYMFATAFPEQGSISGQGCSRENWLDRVSAVKSKHNIPQRDTCVTSIRSRADGVMLAKCIGADYIDFPTSKPHKWKTIIQVGFPLMPDMVQYAARNFCDKDTRKVICWTPEDIFEVWNKISVKAANDYATVLNNSATQFVEDKEAQTLMQSATKDGFNVRVLPMPLPESEKVNEWPEKPRFLVDVQENYKKVFGVIMEMLPDVDLEYLPERADIGKYSGMLHFYSDRTLSNSIKRMALSGRNIISNVQQPFCGFVDDMQIPECFVPEIVNKLRRMANAGKNMPAHDYWKKILDPEKFKTEVCK